MFNYDAIVNNIKGIKEKYVFELKKATNSVPKSLWETYSSFSNTKGGLIILGVEEGTEENIVTGVNNPEKIVSDLWNQLSNQNKVSYNSLNNDDIIIKTIEYNKSIIIIRVNEVPWSKKPVYINNDITKSYIRTGDGDRLMKDDELRIIMRNSSPQMDSIILEQFSIEDLDPISVVSFKEKVTSRYPNNGYESLKPEEFLIEIGVMRKNRTTNNINPTKGALLFLGKYNSIREIYPSFHMDYFNRKGNNERWIDRVATDEPSKFQMNIYNFYNTVNEKLNALNYNEFKLDKSNTRIENNQFNEAIREAFVNTLAHADYDLGLPSVKIEVFDGWMRFVNPGTMLISIHEFVQGGISKPRNEIIMKLFRLLGASERQGFGGPQIFKSAKSNDYRIPEIYTNLEYTELKLWHIDLVDSYPELSDEEKSVFECIVKAPGPIAKREIENSLNLTEYRVRKILDSLLDSQKIERIGNGPSTRYILRIGSAEMLTQLQMMVNRIHQHYQ